MIGAHRGAFEYDWRARFGLPLREVGESMTWGEAHRLTRLLVNDPSSYVAAAVLKWDHPIDRADVVMRDLYDLQHVSKAKKGSRPKPYPRPWPDKTKRRLGNARMTPAELRALLDAHRDVGRRDKNGRLHDARGRFMAETEVTPRG